VLVNKINYAEEGPTVLLFVGVNGVGKTTTIAKIAKKEIDNKKKYY
jgi:signal recognition particle-docking protein FtsY